MEDEELKPRKRKKHKTFLNNIRDHHNMRKEKTNIIIRKKNVLKNKVQAFKTYIEEGPFYVFIVSNRNISRRTFFCFRFQND